MNGKFLERKNVSLSKNEQELQNRIKQLERDLRISQQYYDKMLRSQNVVVPRFNKLYGTLRSEDSWKYTQDGYATGNLTTIASTQVQSKVVLSGPSSEQGTAPFFRQDQWPGAISCHLVIRSFGIAPQTTVTTLGELEILFIDQFGMVVPLGEVPSNTGINYQGIDIILPTPITDPGMASSVNGLGVLTVTLNPGAGSTAIYNWSMGFAVAYMLPSEKLYEIHTTEKWESREKYHVDLHNEKND